MYRENEEGEQRVVRSKKCVFRVVMMAMERAKVGCGKEQKKNPTQAHTLHCSNTQQMTTEGKKN